MWLSRISFSTEIAADTFLIYEGPRGIVNLSPNTNEDNSPNWKARGKTQGGYHLPRARMNR